MKTNYKKIIQDLTNEIRFLAFDIEEYQEEQLDELRERAKALRDKVFDTVSTSTDYARNKYSTSFYRITQQACDTLIAVDDCKKAEKNKDYDILRNSREYQRVCNRWFGVQYIA